MKKTLLSLCLMACVACGNDDGMSGADAGVSGDAGTACAPLDPKFSVLFAEIFNTPTCNLAAACHGMGAQGDLLYDTDVATAHMQTTGDTFRTDSRGQFPKRVESGMPDQSFLWIKLTDSMVPGGQMPLAANPLNQCQLDAVKAWIENGAAND